MTAVFGRKPRVILLTAFPWVRLSGPVSNAKSYLESRKIPTRVFGEPSDYWAVPKSKNVDENRHVEECRNTYARGVKIWRTLSWFYPDFAKYERSFRFVVRNLPRLRADYLIGYDPEGAVRAYFASRFLGMPYLVHSLEFAEEHPTNRIEHAAFRNARFVLAPDRHRLDILKRQYDLEDSQLVALPNSDQGDFNPVRSDFLRERLGIENQKKIILCMGTLTRDHCVDEIIAAAAGWGNGVVLVLHGWCLSDEDRLAVHKINNRYPGRIALSEGLVAFEDREKVFQSADLGIIAFSNRNFNTLHTAGAAGKFFGFAKAGVPVAVKNTPGMSQILKENPVGFLVEDFQGLDKLADSALDRRSEFLPCCKRFFEANEFGLNFGTLLERIGILNPQAAP